MTAVARCAAQFQGWYADRRTVQVSVIAGLVTGMVIVGGLISVAMRGTWRRSFLPLMGLVFVICFVAVRAVGFHHVDRLINLRAQDFRLNALLELAGPVLIIAGGLLLLRFASERPVSRE
jgi:Na+/alanine symporter